MPIPLFDDEEEFRAWYLPRETAREQLEALREWRLRQSRMVGSLGQMIGAGEQYTQVDHFLLELLQNADDNDYAVEVTPSLTITLEVEQCVFSCNEIGFTSDKHFRHLLRRSFDEKT